MASFYLTRFAAMAVAFTALPATAQDPVKQEPLEIKLLHDTMTMHVGTPAIIVPGGAYPELRIVSHLDTAGSLTGEIVRTHNDSVAISMPSKPLRPGEEAAVAFPGKPEPGQYRIDLQLMIGDRAAFRDSYFFSVFDPASLAPEQSVAAHLGKDGKMTYVPDFRGNRIPDFSSVGYMKGATELPDVPVKVTLTADPSDATKRIQAAIDEVSAMKPDARGFRGAILLKKGIYQVGKLSITTGGVVIRGEGPGGDAKVALLDPAAGLSEDAFKQKLSGVNGTILLSKGALIELKGASGIHVEESPKAEVLDAYVPVGATKFHVGNPGNLRVGDPVMVKRHGNAAWIHAIGMDQIPKAKKQWTPFDLNFERTITAIHGSQITIDSPIVTAIETRWGGGHIHSYQDAGRISQCGVENLRMVQYVAADPVSGLGKFRGNAIRFSNVKDAWIRDVVTEHFYDNGIILLGADTRNITVKSCSLLNADDRYFTGYVPRYGINVGAGGNANLHLVENCYVESCRHAYYVDAHISGPNVFYNSVGAKDVTNSEPHHLWASGGLFDNMQGNIGFMNRLALGSGHGWAGANFVAWNTRGRLICERPPTAQNWAIGHIGFKSEAPNQDWRPRDANSYDGGGFGHWELHNNPQRIDVKASDHEFNRLPESTLADHPYTYWMVSKPKEWIQYDLQRPQKLSELKISFPAPPRFQDGKKATETTKVSEKRTYLFDIAVSNDAKNWKTVLEGAKGLAQGYQALQTFDFADVEARYVRINAKGSIVGDTADDSSDWFHMCRVKFLPEPQFDPVKPVQEVVPASLYRQQLKERLNR